MLHYASVISKQHTPLIYKLVTSAFPNRLADLLGPNYSTFSSLSYGLLWPRRTPRVQLATSLTLSVPFYCTMRRFASIMIIIQWLYTR
jgi:hypothetical protein